MVMLVSSSWQCILLKEPSEGGWRRVSDGVQLRALHFCKMCIPACSIFSNPFLH